MPRKNSPSYEIGSSIFAQRLTEAMKKRGENQTTLAEKITTKYVTIQRQTISLYMNGQSRPDTERLTAIAKVLDVSADWLLGLSDVMSANFAIQEICQQTGLAETIVYVLCEKEGERRLFSGPEGFNAVFSDTCKLSYFFEILQEYVSNVSIAHDTIETAKSYLSSLDKDDERNRIKYNNKLFSEINAALKEVRYSRLEFIDYTTELVQIFAKKCGVDDRSCGPDILYPEDIIEED